MKKEFAVSPAYFVLSNIEDPIKREEKRDEIHDFLFSRIGDLSNMERTRKMIVMAFAAVCYHSKYIDKHMHPRNPFRATTIWKDLQPEITSYARITYPWDQTSDTPSFTGIPPHVTLLADIAELKREMQSLRKQFATDLNEIMDDRGVGDSEFSTRRVLEALDIHTATLSTFAK